MGYVIKGSTGAWEIVCGLEVHAQVTARSKLFSGASAAFGGTPNSHVSLIDAAMPGMLPVINALCIEQAVRSGLGLNAQINKRSIFERKNYFYPDLPQGYQISQYAHPIVGQGALLIDCEDGGSKEIRITRLHLEQDAGKSVHDVLEDETLIDFNRAGCALMEIVSEPDIRSPEEAHLFLKKLRSILRYLDTCNGNMEEGSLRCDANVSVRPDGDQGLRTRCEIKNLNSLRFVAKAIEVEAERQVELYESGGDVIQQTRLFDARSNETRAMRGKEEAFDYRYFPDPDLLPLVLPDSLLARIKNELPELPDAKKRRFVSDYQLSDYDADVLIEDKAVAAYFEEVAQIADAKLATNWVMNDLLALLGHQGLDIGQSPISAVQLGELLLLVSNDRITSRTAKDVFRILANEGGSAEAIVEARGLAQVSDSSTIEPLVDRLIAENPPQVEKSRQNPKILGWFTGQVMQATKGKANPKLVNDLLRRKIGL